ncbi:peptide chain release factor N(5)-glutamine methyltransferase [Salicola sp. Rm-C-2C1-2]|uniref:peptide chain release factor N(5)-glutamine methyltransferase n=1 Tax=Salicola sp. Rm-C-2C1-2 TaxID=3141321 RepID=UPI0032E4541F
MSGADRVEALLDDAACRLEAAGMSNAAGEARMLLAHQLGCSPSRFRIWPEALVGDDDAETFRTLVAARAGGRPLAYITEECEFWSLPLKVTPATLIPRPDTETLVEAAIACPLPEVARVLDVGTGSGAVALALAQERPDWYVTASETSGEALAVAETNASTLGLKVTFVEGDLLAPFHETDAWDLIVSNPPYVAADDPHLCCGDLRYEPQSALAAGADGLDVIRPLVAGALQRLAPGGWLLLEHGYDQALAIAALLKEAGFGSCFMQHDLAGNPRVSGGRRED